MSSNLKYIAPIGHKTYADDGTLYAELFVEKRVPISITEMPRHLKLAFVAIEDVRFFITSVLMYEVLPSCL
jgi:membrane carboxypeptidase/penicillin-binding protein